MNVAIAGDEATGAKDGEGEAEKLDPLMINAATGRKLLCVGGGKIVKTIDNCNLLGWFPSLTRENDKSVALMEKSANPSTIVSFFF